jgi:uncharacterized membrane protein YkoI
MLRPKIIQATMVAVIALGGTGAAFAGAGAKEVNEQEEIAAVLNAKTSLTQAIAAAEQQTGGKAIDTGLENQDGTMAFEVKVAKGSTVQKVLIDLDSGKVIKVMAADADHDEGGDNDED